MNALPLMTKKVSTHTVSPLKDIGDELNYSQNYTYYAGKSHQAEIIGNLYYEYDANGNVTEARKGGHATGAVPSGEVYRNGDVEYVDQGFALLRNGDDTLDKEWSREYTWNEENRLAKSVEGDLTVEYRYGADGERAVKYSKNSETLYFDSMWQAVTDYPTFRQSKHVYVGKVRIASRLNISGTVDVGYEESNTYYYHPDHVGSAQLVTDPAGEEYERIEYTPYGELWVEKVTDSVEKIPFRFTGKELDEETGLYYYGARYLDPKTSSWLSADPALGDYIPVAPVDEEARKKNGNLPGMGGVYNLVNLHLYHYAGNNPVKYTDPDGNDIKAAGAVLSFALTDLVIPEPTDAAAIPKAAIYALAALGALIFVATEAQKEQPKQTLYHYSVSPEWKGGVFPQDGYLTDNPAMSSQEARSKLALPNVAPGQQLYLYALQVSPGDVTNPKPVDPMASNITGEMMPGGGTEYQATRPLVMEQPIGVPVRNE